MTDQTIASLQSTLNATLPHEFFTPLNGILGLVEVLQADITQLPRSDVQEILGDIERSGLRLHRTLRNYLMLFELRNAVNTALKAAPLQTPEALHYAIRAGAESAAKHHQ